MSQNDNTKIISVRSDNDTIKTLDNILAAKKINRNALINKMILEFIIANNEKSEFKNINLKDNIDKLGFSKSFIDKETARFVINNIIAMEKRMQNDRTNKQMPILNISFSDDMYKEMEQDLLLTGVKYTFKTIGLTIFNSFGFSEGRDLFNKPTLDVFNFSYAYFEKTKEFIEIDEHDYLNFEM